MSNNKQNSLDWFISQLQKSKDWHRVLNEVSQMHTAKVDIIEQAKAMHKEEIIKAVTFGQNNHTVMVSQDLIIAEEYYNETFGGKQ